MNGRWRSRCGCIESMSKMADCFLDEGVLFKGAADYLCLSLVTGARQISTQTCVSTIMSNRV